MKNVVFLTGSAGTGKTFVMESLKETQPHYTYRDSITRAFYASKGVTNEVEYFSKMDDAGRKAFQLELFDFYISNTKSFITTSANDVLTVIDRSPIDHLAYAVFSIPDLNKEEYDVMVSKTDEFFKWIKDQGITVKVFEFKYPAPWTVSKNISSDGFRYDPFGKTYTISALMSSEINNFTVRNKAYDMFKVCDSVNFATGATYKASERAATILKATLG